MAVVKSTPKVQEKEIRSYLDRMETGMIEELRHGNIFKVFANSKFKVADFQDFFANQWKAWKGDVIKDEEIMAMKASFHEPNINMLPIQNKSMTLNDQQNRFFQQEMLNHIAKESSIATAKASKVIEMGKRKDATAQKEDAESAEAATEPDEVMGLEELQDTARGTLGDWDQFMSDAWVQILDAQMMSDYQTRMGEIKKEVDRIIALAKQGKIGAEFVLIALAKVNSTRNGVLISGLGKKAAFYNDSMNQISKDLYGMDPSSPNYTGQLQMAQSSTRDKNFQLNLVTQDMQKVMQDLASVMDQVQGMIQEMNRVKREIIQQLAARG